MKTTYFLLFILLGYSSVGTAQDEVCLPAEQRQLIKDMIATNRVKYGIEKGGNEKSLPNAYIWPVVPSPTTNAASVTSICQFVDHDPSEGLLDWNCGDQTYNGHRGTDICCTPYPWYMVENEEAHIVAMASGTILWKMDGNDSYSCDFSQPDWNGIGIQHSDGSTAWYGHLKENSLTTKSVGQSVTPGEYLGVMASSGMSTGPHLHIEIYDANDNLVDPYAGSCNGLNPTTSYWQNQPDYYHVGINRVTVQSAPAEYGPDCNSIENPNYLEVADAGDVLNYRLIFSGITAGTSVDYRIVAPDGTNLFTQSSNLVSDNFGWTIGATYTLPNDVVTGNYRFEATYLGVTVDYEFEVAGLTNNCSETTVVVTNTNDSGPGSLRAALECANSSVETDTVLFDLPGNVPHVISLLTHLPTLSDDNIVLSTFLSGYVLGDVVLNVENMEPSHVIITQGGDDLVIEGIRIMNAPSVVGTGGINVKVTNGTVVRNNWITQGYFGIIVGNFSSNVIVEDNVIGTDLAGNADLGLGRAGIGTIFGVNNSTVRRNLIANCNWTAIVCNQSSNGNLFTENTMYCNGRGIHLDYGGSEGNNGLPAPEVLTASATGVSGTAAANSFVEIYLSGSSSCPNAVCQGSTYVGQSVADPSGTWSYSGNFNPGDRVTALNYDTNNNTSEFSGCAEVPSSPFNNDCSTAANLNVSPTGGQSQEFGPYNNYGATGESISNNCGQSSTGGGVWFSFTGDDDDLQMLVETTVGSSSFNFTVTVFQGGCGSLTEIGCGNNSGSDPISFATSAGESYLIYIEGAQPGEEGEFMLSFALQNCHPDLDGLMALYSSTNGPGWTNKSGWEEGAAGTSCDPCNFNGGTWYGIQCESGRVTVVDLDGNTAVNLAGSGNNLTGNIPSALYQIENLSNLNLTNNNLFGIIPAGISQLQNLWVLNLNGNELSGQIPAEIGQLINLRALRLSGNNLTESIPGELGLLQNLQRFQLQNNQLSGRIPAELGQLENLSDFLLNDNQLSESIPSELGQLGSLQQFFLHNNNLSGPIPPELSLLNVQFQFFLHNNNLTGCIPVSFASRCGNTVDMSGNPGLAFEGNFDTWCTDNQSVGAPCNDANPITTNDAIDAECNCTGQLPVACDDGVQNGDEEGIDCGGTNCAPCPCLHPDYDALMAIYNSMGGDNWTRNGTNGNPTSTTTGWGRDCEPCSWYGIVCTAERVTCLDLDGLITCNPAAQGGNNLTGVVPEEISGLTELRNLSMSFNDIEGTIPASITSLTNLETIGLDNNRIGGEIPADIGQLTNLTAISLSTNELVGPFPMSIGNLQNLTSIGFQGNQLSGPIPPQLGNCAELILLNCNQNDLSGTIPPELGGLQNLRTFSFFRNNLEGEIPASLGNLDLAILNLAENNLEGCYDPALITLCDVNELRLEDNPLLPFEGDISQWCNNGNVSIGAPCNDGNPGTSGEQILADCSCGIQPATCDDGLQNGDEEGIDCGGSNCVPCFVPCNETGYTYSIEASDAVVCSGTEITLSLFLNADNGNPPYQMIVAGPAGVSTVYDHPGDGSAVTFNATPTVTGVYRIEALIDGASCSYTNAATVAVTVEDPIADPVLSCVTTTQSSITIGWDVNAAAERYELYVDGAGPQIVEGGTFTVNNLPSDEAVNFELFLVSTSVCFEPFSLLSCRTLPDPCVEDAPLVNVPSATGLCAFGGIVDLSVLEADILLGQEATVEWFTEAAGGQVIADPQNFAPATAPFTVYVRVTNIDCASVITPITLDRIDPQVPSFEVLPTILCYDDPIYQLPQPTDGTSGTWSLSGQGIVTAINPALYGNTTLLLFFDPDFTADDCLTFFEHEIIITEPSELNISLSADTICTDSGLVVTILGADAGAMEVVWSAVPQPVNIVTEGNTATFYFAEVGNATVTGQRIVNGCAGEPVSESFFIESCEECARIIDCIPQNGQSASLVMIDTFVDVGATVCIPILVAGLSSFVDLGFSLQWDSAVFTFVEVRNLVPELGAVPVVSSPYQTDEVAINIATAASGTMSFYWRSFAPEDDCTLAPRLTLPDATVLFEVCLQATQAPLQSETSLAFVNQPQAVTGNKVQQCQNEGDAFVAVFGARAVFNGACEHQDYGALMALYESTNGSEWDTKTGWQEGADGTSCNPCDFNGGTWYGIECENERVTRIDMIDNNLTGPLPEEINRLTQLFLLRLPRNNIVGPLPQALGELPNLGGIYLFSNDITGPIPQGVWERNTMQVVNMEGNRISGTLPSSFSGVPNLLGIVMGGNELEGEIPVDIGNLNRLEFCYLTNNRLTGIIPASIVNATNLEDLYLNNNQLEGDLPVDIGNLVKIINLNVSTNTLSGELPASLGSLPDVQTLNFFGNNLMGSIPESISTLSSLVSFNVGNNALTGSLPADMSQMSSIRNFIASGNNLAGEISSNFTGLELFEQLNLADNNFSGEIPESLGGLPRIRVINFINNDMSGCIPSSFESFCGRFLSINFTGNIKLPYQGDFNSWCNADAGDLAFCDDGNPFTTNDQIDENCNCVGESLAICETSDLTLFFGEIIRATCSIDNGSIEANVLGGLPPYQYNWSNGDTSDVASNLAAGDYDLTVTDAEGCTATLNVPLTAINPVIPVCPGDLMIVVDANADSLLFDVVPPAIGDCSDDGLTYRVSGATTISGPGIPAALVLNLGENIISFTTEVDSCSYTVTVNAPEMDCADLRIIPVASRTAACFGSGDGFIETDVMGGSGNYDISWSTGQELPDLFDLEPEVYVLTVLDLNTACTVTAGFWLQSPDSIQIECVVVAGETVTNALVSFSGAALPVTLDLAGPAEGRVEDLSTTDYEFTDLAPGAYEVVLTDANGCQAFCSFEVLAEPDNCEDPANQPTISLDALNSYVICPGQSTELVLLLDSNQIVEWRAEPDGIVVGREPSLTASTATTYSFAIFDTISGCVIDSFVTIMPDQRMPVVVCPEDTTVLLNMGQFTSVTVSSGIPEVVFAPCNDISFPPAEDLQLAATDTYTWQYQSANGQGGSCVRTINVIATDTMTIYVDEPNIYRRGIDTLMIPIAIRNWSNVASFIFDLEATVQTAGGTLVPIALAPNPAFVDGIDIELLSPTRISVTWTSAPGEMDVPSDFRLLELPLVVTGNPGDCVNLHFGTSFDNAATAMMEGQQIYLSTVDGLACLPLVASMSGNVFRLRPDLTVAPLANVTLELQQQEEGSLSSLSLEDGRYRFEELPVNESYEIVPSLADDFRRGIDLLDVVLLRDIWLNYDNPVSISTPYQLIAANVFPDCQINFIDLTFEVQMMLGGIDSFPGNTPWRFIPSAFEFPEEYELCDPVFPESITYSPLLEDQPAGDFIGVKTGDLSLNASSPLLEGSTEIEMDDQLFREGDTVRVSRKLGVGEIAASVYYRYDLSTLSYLPSYNRMKGQSFRLNYSNKAGYIDQVLIDAAGEDELVFIAMKDGRLSKALSLREGSQVASLDHRFNALKLRWKDVALAATGIEFSLFPNPFSDRLFLRFESVLSDDADLTIRDLTGRTLYQDRLTAGTDRCVLETGANNLPPGVYLVTVENGLVAQRKMVIRE